MLFKLLILFVVCMSCTGCITILKQQIPKLSQPSDVCSDLSEKKPDMVWVEAKTSKIWVSPHLDDNGDMVEGHFKYTVITSGHWGIKGS